jgi:signal peptidase I
VVKLGKHLILTFLAAGILFFLLRQCVCTIIAIPQGGNAPTFLQGDRVLLNKWSYGLRLPRTDWFGYQRVRRKPLRKYDWIAFNSPQVCPDALPDTSSLCVGRVIACPGDTVWMGKDGLVSDRKDFRRGCIWPLVVPARGMHVHISPWGVTLYALTIQRHEGENATAKGDTLFAANHSMEFYRFHRDYCWVSSGNDANLFDSRSFGFVPAEHVVGRLDAVLYSLDGEQPWYRILRKKRFFRTVE